MECVNRCARPYYGRMPVLHNQIKSGRDYRPLAEASGYSLCFVFISVSRSKMNVCA
jgi:hypothetical protein